MNLRRSVILALFCSGALAASWAEAQSAQRKFEAIQEGRLRPGAGIAISSGELNSWVSVKAKYYVPQGLRNPRLEFGSGRITGSALIDFVKLQQAETGALPGWIAKNLFAGERPVTVSARLESRDGRARVFLESVEVSGVQIQGQVLEFLIERYLLPAFPAARIGEWFELEGGIDRLTVDAGGVFVYMGGVRRAGL
jgi:hypothetical protein